MNEPEVAGEIERFVRERFSISPTDPHFSGSANLFEGGYVDSVGLTELLAHIEERFGIFVPDDELVSDEFTSIDGMARIVSRAAEPA